MPVATVYHVLGDRTDGSPITKAGTKVWFVYGQGNGITMSTDADVRCYEVRPVPKYTVTDCDGHV